MVRYFYLDSSVAANILLGQSTHAALWFDSITADSDSEIIASRILRTELTRVLRREKIPVSRRDHVLDYVGLIPISNSILAEAEAVLPHVKTLDAIHLASLLHTGLLATLVTHDVTMKSVATEIGYDTFDPVSAA